MMSSRGMGAMSPSKMPKKKEITRKDDPNKVAMYKKGGKVKKMAEGDLVDDVNVKPNYVALDKNFKAIGARLEGKKSLGKDSELSAYMDLDAMKVGNQSTKAKASKVGVNYTKRFSEGGKAKSKVNEAGNYTKPELRKRIFNSVKAAAIVGTGAGQWSARKAQVMAKRYKAAGGGYRD